MFSLMEYRTYVDWSEFRRYHREVNGLSRREVKEPQGPLKKISSNNSLSSQGSNDTQYSSQGDSDEEEMGEMGESELEIGIEVL